MRRASSRRGADADDARARHQSSRELAREFCRRHASRSAFSPNAPTHACAHSIDARHRSRHRSIDLARRSMGGERPIGSDRIDRIRGRPCVSRAHGHTDARARGTRAKEIFHARRASGCAGQLRDRGATIRNVDSSAPSSIARAPTETSDAARGLRRDTV